MDTVHAGRVAARLAATLLLVVALLPHTSGVAAGEANRWMPTGSMTIPRTAFTATLLPNGQALVVGGSNDRSGPATPEVYDPQTGHWMATGAMHTDRYRHAAVLLANGMVLVAGGENGGHILSSAELYDPRTGQWTVTGSMHQARRWHTMTLLPDGMVLVAGGQDEKGFELASAELYDPSSGTWTPTGAMHVARIEHTATVLATGQVLVTGGENGTPLSSAELYDSRTGRWIMTGAMGTPRVGHTATLLPTGQVLVTGGWDGSTLAALASAELYDPATGQWTPTAAMSSARDGHTATLLADGRVLVAGGTSSANISNPPFLSSAELYDPRSTTWTAVGPMSTARAGHTATVLPSGQVLVAGGVNTTCCASLADAELFTLGDSPLVRLSPTALDFDRQRLGTSSAIQTVTITNVGTLPLAISSVGVTPTVAADYVIADACSPKPLVPGQTCTIGVRFRPVAAGSHTATLTVVDNAPDSPQYVALSGLGISTSAVNSWRATGSMTSVRQEHTATLLPGGKVLVAGGCAGGGAFGNGVYVCSPPLASAEIYDMRTGKWTATARMGEARADHRAVPLSTHAVLVVGGRADGSAELYDVTHARWSATGRLHVPRIAFTATLLPNGKVLAAGGAQPGFYQLIEGIASAELYDPARGTWMPTGGMVTQRWDQTATLLPNGRVLVAGGEDECDQKGGTCIGLRTAEVYDPRTGTWRTTGSMMTGRHLHTATLLTTGQVLVAGGYGTDGEPPLRSAELYNPRTGTWRATGSMQIAFARASATLLPSGQVLVVGTPQDTDNAFNAELYDPRTGHWSAGSMLMKRYGLTATLLPNGTVLVAGGSTAGAELYLPRRR